ncbi:MAG: hypothetical protein RLY14_802 [Planctomycetota bacterium]|jgi:hypothetical protein
MKNILAVLPFVAMTFLSWGVYGPLLHEGKHAMENSSLRPFVGVGIAYFFIAVLVPVLMLRRGEKGFWSVGGTLLSFLAGSVGALGALGVILALTAGGKPIFVMPVVFGFAPVVNTLVTSWLSKTFDQINPRFLAGMAAVALGAVGVLVFKPATPTPAASHAAATHSTSNTDKPATNIESSDSSGAKSDSSETKEEATSTATDATATTDAKSEEKSGDSATNGETSSSEKTEKKVTEEKVAEEKATEKKEGDAASDHQSSATPQAAKPAAATANSSASSLNLRVIGSLIMAALCWGSYGPFLHIGQMKMGGSRLRPFCCVGLAYFIIAVALPLMILAAWQEPGKWTFSGTLWSIAAGSAGALGALGIILAFNFGGKPIYVMPLIFGFAPVVNTLTTMITSGTIQQGNFFFLASLAVVIAGAVTVLIFAPKPKPHAAPAK